MLRGSAGALGSSSCQVHLWKTSSQGSSSISSFAGMNGAGTASCSVTGPACARCAAESVPPVLRLRRCNSASRRLISRAESIAACCARMTSGLILIAERAAPASFPIGMPSACVSDGGIGVGCPTLCDAPPDTGACDGTGRGRTGGDGFKNRLRLACASVGSHAFGAGPSLSSSHALIRRPTGADAAGPVGICVAADEGGRGAAMPAAVGGP